MTTANHFSIKRRISFYETDAMGVVHHSNYLRFFEEARMHWLNDRDIQNVKWDNEPKSTLAVIESSMRHLAPAKYNDLIEIKLHARQEGTCVRFNYTVIDETGKILTTGMTRHAPVNEALKAVRLPTALRKILKGEPWIET